MPVYVDDMKAGLGRMVMCHMVADTEAELHAMADLIGVDRKWYQYPRKSRYPHYDIAQSKRALAVSYGAKEIRLRDAPAISRRCLAAMKLSQATPMHTYTNISFADGTHCICKSTDVAELTKGSEGHTTTEVQMTEAEFNALPEFQA